MARFDKKRVLITGGTSGIGLATAVRVATEGGSVMVTGRSAEGIAKAKAMLPDIAVAFANDAADPQAAHALAEAVKAKWGGLDCVFLNAGYGALDPETPEDFAVFDAITNANVRGPVLQMSVLDPLIADHGSVLLTSSVAPYIGSTSAVYATTKAAMISLARSWARAMAGRGIRVNAVGPGPIETQFFERLIEDDAKREGFAERLKGFIPLGRFGGAEEVASVASFLLSDEASFVTGSEYMVDGGMTLR